DLPGDLARLRPAQVHGVLGVLVPLLIAGLRQHQVDPPGSLTPVPTGAGVTRVEERTPTSLPTRADAGNGVIHVGKPNREIADRHLVAAGHRLIPQGAGEDVLLSLVHERHDALQDRRRPVNGHVDTRLRTVGPRVEDREQVGAVVGVLVGDDHGVDRVRVYRKAHEGSRPGVTQDAGVAVFDQVAGTGATRGREGAGGADDVQL